MLAGCRSENSGLKLSENQLSASQAGNTFEIRVTSGSSWMANTSAEWISLSKTTSKSSSLLRIYVQNNIFSSERQGEITFSNESGQQQTLVIKQDAHIDDPQNPAYVGESYYKIPVVFHVLYNDANDPLQNVSKENIYAILKDVNQKYLLAGQGSSNIRLEFVLAERDPQGRLLEEKGISRVHWDEPMIDAVSFMNEDRDTYLALIWDPNKYVNIMLYNFTVPNLLGISTFPLMPPQHPLLTYDIAPSATLTADQLDKVRCLSINSTPLYDRDGNLDPGMGVTLAHELGHYLGLRHTFGEEADLLYSCRDSDGCLDTPSYNKREYDAFVEAILKKYNSDENFRNSFNPNILYQRTSCPPESEAFEARNIMDYDFCRSNLFTEDQKAIMRHVLRYSPFVPGPKDVSETKATKLSGPIPHSTSYCPPSKERELKELMNKYDKR